jgi:16S rRNA (uracil1498-N3)-methyltransferase
MTTRCLIPDGLLPGPGALAVGAEVALPEAAAHHLARVLRVRAGTPVVVFDGGGGEYRAEILRVARDGVEIRVLAFDAVDRESPLAISLVQGISRGERMDYTLQKAVELGIYEILPVWSERCGVSLDEARQGRREAHWRGVIAHACEQSGRTRVPILHPCLPLAEGLARATGQGADVGAGAATGALCLVLVPEAQSPLPTPAPGGAVSLAVGPEGGFSDLDLAACAAAGYRGVRLGPRILRTETAALACLALLQGLAGDLGR